MEQQDNLYMKGLRQNLYSDTTHLSAMLTAQLVTIPYSNYDKNPVQTERSMQFVYKSYLILVPMVVFYQSMENKQHVFPLVGIEHQMVHVFIWMF